VKILLLGGYGVFGGRLAELLADCSDLELLIAGRSVQKAAAFCARYRGAARARPLQLDRADIGPALESERPDLVVDASGPFQAYGAQRYAVIEACIAARTDYLDFADAADFVAGVPGFDGAARDAEVFVLSGVSSFPVLTAAVLRKMATTMDIVAVAGGIAPSPYAGVGLNVMRAVVSYAGAPVKLCRGGHPAVGRGLAETMRYTVAVPGKVPLGNLLFSLVDVPDLQVIPPEHPTLTDIWMGAGPVPEILHRVLVLLAKARARLRLPSLVPLAPLFYWVLNAMKFGEHRGGMFVHVRGRTGGREVERSWHLLAEGDDGPYIPSMAIEGIVRKLVAGARPQAGARAGTRALELADYDRLFEDRAISSGFREHAPAESLYRQLLDSAFDRLPLPLREVHGSTDRRRWSGIATVRTGRSVAARLIRALFGLPGRAGETPVSVTFEPLPNGAGERWTRDFGGKTFASVQTPGSGRDSHLLVERFGPFAFAIALVVDGDRLDLVQRGWSFLSIPLPKVLLPTGPSFETVREGRFAFDVRISLPLIGLIVAYSGTLEPA
jgi:hypothetical protein